MRTLVVGGAGFLGSHLIERLLSETQDEVVCFDNLSMGSEKNLSGFMKNPRFRFEKVDILDLDALVRVAKNCQRIAHLAAFKIPRYGGRIDTLKINAQGMMNVSEAARINQARLIFTSTSDVYGKNANVPFTEKNDCVIGPSTSARWAYAVSKLMDEQLVFAYQEAHGLQATIIRIFGSYGPRHHLSWWGGPQSVFISAFSKGESIELHGDGQQTRSFCFVDDTVGGIFAALESPKSVGEIINVGNEEEISIFSLAKTIHELMGIPGEMKFKLKPLSELSRDYEDVRRRVPNISKAKQLLNWQPNVKLREGLLTTIKWQLEAEKNKS